MTQKFIIPPRTTDGNEIRKFFVNICQYINRMMEVDNSLARAYLTSNQAINNNEITKVSGYTESFDAGSNFSSDKFTAPVAGYYQISFGVTFYDATVKLTFAYGMLYKNGADTVHGSEWSGTDKAEVLSTGSDVVYLDAGNYLELYGYCTTSDSGASVMYAGSKYTFMSVHLIARA